MANSKIPFIKGVNTVPRLLGSNYDLDDLYNLSDSGFYYISTGVTNSPAEYAGLIVIAYGTGFSAQLVIQFNRMYYRTRMGTPAAWGSWKQVSVVS